MCVKLLSTNGFAKKPGNNGKGRLNRPCQGGKISLILFLLALYYC